MPVPPNSTVSVYSGDLNSSTCVNTKGTYFYLLFLHPFTVETVSSAFQIKLILLKRLPLSEISIPNFRSSVKRPSYFPSFSLLRERVDCGIGAYAHRTWTPSPGRVFFPGLSAFSSLCSFWWKERHLLEWVLHFLWFIHLFSSILLSTRHAPRGAYLRS